MSKRSRIPLFKPTLRPTRVVEIVPAAVVEMVPVAVVEMVPVCVVEIVPAAVVEIVPALVVEIVPFFGNALPESVRVRSIANIADLNFLMTVLLVD